MVRQEYSPWMAAFSPDGTLVATGTRLGSMTLIDPLTGRLVARWNAHGFAEISSIGFSPDSARLVSSAGSTVKIWDVSTGDAARPLATAEANSHVIEARFSPDGAYVLTADQEGTAQVWEAGSGEELFALRGHTDRVWSAEFSPGGDRVLTGSEDATARVWSVNTGQELRGHFASVNAVGFSPDGELLVTAGSDGFAHLRRADTGELVHKLRPFLPLRSVAFSPAGDKLIAGETIVGEVSIWSARTGRELGRCCDHVKYTDIRTAQYSPSGAEERILVLYENGSAWLFDIGKVPEGGAAEVLQKFGGREAELSLAAFTPEGDVLTLGRFDRRARIWDSTSGEELTSWPIGNIGVLTMSVSPDGKTLVTGGVDRRIRSWDVSSGEFKNESLRGGRGTPVSITFSPDGDWIVAGGSDGAITIWDADSLALLGVMQVHSDFVGSVAVSVDDRIISGSDDGTAKISTCGTCGAMKEVKAMALRHLAETSGAS
jgi:WD40 repeat protein